jgi:hypothetical protein
MHSGAERGLLGLHRCQKTPPAEGAGFSHRRRNELCAMFMQGARFSSSRSHSGCKFGGTLGCFKVNDTVRSWKKCMLPGS